jgi:predicted Zn-dependent protease
LAKSGDWLNAGAIYHVALDEAIAGYDDLVQSMDHKGDISVVMDDLAEGLGKALEKSRAGAKTRWDWIETMLEALLADIELGGISLTPSADEAVLKLANDEEWERIVERLRTEAAHGRDWKRGCLIGFMAEGFEQRKRPDEANELIRDLGTSEQRADLLIREGKIDEAMKMIKKILARAPGWVTNFADALLSAGAKKEALALVQEQGSDHWENKDWLAKYYRKHGSPQEAIEA